MMGCGQLRVRNACVRMSAADCGEQSNLSVLLHMCVCDCCGASASGRQHVLRDSMPAEALMLSAATMMCGTACVQPPACTHVYVCGLVVCVCFALSSRWAVGPALLLETNVCACVCVCVCLCLCIAICHDHCAGLLCNALDRSCCHFVLSSLYPPLLKAFFLPSSLVAVHCAICVASTIVSQASARCSC